MSYKEVKKSTKIIWSIIGLILLYIIGYLYGAFYGLPWKKVSVGNEIHHYLEDKYNEDFVIEERIYNFKDGHYGIKVHPKKDKSMSFFAEEGYGEYEYVDYYAESIWENQLKKDYEDMVKKLFPEHTEINAGSPMGIGIENVKDGKIPNYKDINETFYIIVRFDQKFDENKEIYENTYKLIQKAQKEHKRMEISLIFEENEELYTKEKNELNGFLNFTEKEISIIDSIEDVIEYSKKDIYE